MNTRAPSPSASSSPASSPSASSSPASSPSSSSSPASSPSSSSPSSRAVGAHLFLQPGTRVDRFIVLHALGHGGMGMVFAAYDPHLQRRVALKLLRIPEAGDRSYPLDDLLGEARTMAQLDHRHIVPVYETGVFRGETYLVMALVAGVTLNMWLRRWGDRPWSSILDVFRETGSALAHAHANGLAHGDFKPENVLIDDRDHARVTDFGLARSIEPHAPHANIDRDADCGERNITVMGTPRYMAPEQYQGQQADALSDQFSFCVALFEALYERHPCAYDTPRSLLQLRSDRAWTAIPQDTQVPRFVARALRKGLSINPNARYSSMYALLADLAPPSKPRSRRFETALLSSIAVACALGYAVGSWTGERAPLDVDARSFRVAKRQINPDTPPASAPPPTSPAVVSSQTPGQAIEPPSRQVQSSVTQPGIVPAAQRGDSHAPGSGYREYANSTSSGDSARFSTVPHAFVAPDQGAIAIAPTPRHDLPDTALHPPIRTDAASGSQRQRAPLARAPPSSSPAAVQAQIVPRWRDLDVCFREWRERNPNGRDTLTVHMTIDDGGRARVYNYRNLTDHVVRACASGVLEEPTYGFHTMMSDYAIEFESVRGDLRMHVQVR